MNLAQCEQQLQTIHQKNPILAENLSQITSQAWGTDKAYCLPRMGGSSGVKTFVFKRASYVPPKEELQVNTEKTSQTVVANQSSFWDTAQLATIKTWSTYIFWAVSIFLL